MLDTDGNLERIIQKFSFGKKQQTTLQKGMQNYPSCKVLILFAGVEGGTRCCRADIYLERKS